METLEEMYTGLLQEHDTIQASNPWGCNQYGHRKGHQGKADSVSEKSRDKSDSDEKQGPAKLPNGAFNIPGLKKPLAIPTPNPGEKNAPVLKPKDMSDEDFREALDLDKTITTRANNVITDYDAFENEWDSDFGKRLRKTKYGPKMREDSGVAYELKERIRRRLNEAKNKTSLTPEDENNLNKAIDEHQVHFITFL